MKDIEVGDYVRTRRGEIFKILTKIKTTYGFCGLTDSSNKKYSTYTYGKGNCIDNNIKGKIVKHSKNIIDLIEPGDFVNNYIVLDVMEDLQTGEIHLEMPSSYPKEGSCTIYNNEIETILTKEQYMQNCYTVERS